MNREDLGAGPVGFEPTTYSLPIDWHLFDQYLITMPHEYFETNIEAEGQEVPEIWERYSSMGEKSLLMGIIYHNLYNLLRSTYIRDGIDALFNLGTAVMAVQLLHQGVHITMNGKVFSWENVFKNLKTGKFETIKQN